MWIALTAALAWAVPTPEEATAAMQEVNARTTGVGFVFLLDSSQSVEPLTEALLSDIADLVNVLPEGDEVAILAFHTRPYHALPRTKITEKGRAELVGRVRKLDLPGGFDRDLGDGLNELGKLLAEPEAPRFQHVIGVSNFCHAPTTMSEWGSGVAGCSPIRNQNLIGKHVKALVEDRRIVARWFPLRDKADLVDVAGADAARRQLGGELVTDSPHSWLQNFRERIASERPRPVAAHDGRHAGFTVSASRPDAEGFVDVTLTGTAKVLDLELENLRWTGLEGELPSALILSPSATVRARVVAPAGPLSLFRRTDTVPVAITVAADGKLRPAAALALLGVDAVQRDLKGSLTLEAERQYGPSPLVSALILLAVAALSGFAAVVVRGRIMPLQLGGRLTARFQGGPRVELNIAQLREAGVVLPFDGSSPSIGEPKRAALVLRVRRPIWQLSAEVDIHSADVEINGKAARQGTHPVVPGATSFRAGEWRLAWE